MDFDARRRDKIGDLLDKRLQHGVEFAWKDAGPDGIRTLSLDHAAYESIQDLLGSRNRFSFRGFINIGLLSGR